jgi:integrase
MGEIWERKSQAAMPRATKDARLDTASARARLSTRKKPHYRLIDAGLHIGYYRGATGGAWIARRYIGAGAYETHRLALADDGREADGKSVLTFTQAQAKARAWATSQGRLAAGLPKQDPWTVAKAIEHYLIDYVARGGKARRFVEITFEAHVPAKLAERKIADLTPSIIGSWHRGLATSPARLRTSAAATTQRTRPLPAQDADARRARRATANRILTQLKAALNLAHRDGHAASDDAWRRVRPFPKVDAAHIRYLTDDEAKRLVNACASDLRELVTAALLTGCRYQELAKLRRADVDLNASVLLIRAAKGGEPRHAVLTAEATEFFARQMAGKSSNALLFERDQVTRQATRTRPTETCRMPWGRSHHFRPLREACEAAGIAPAVSFHILRHTHASRLAMRGVPMSVIAAQLGHASVRMTEKHYAHLAPSYVADTIRNSFGSMGLVEARNVKPLKREVSKGA